MLNEARDSGEKALESLSCWAGKYFVLFIPLRSRVQSEMKSSPHDNEDDEKREERKSVENSEREKFFSQFFRERIFMWKSIDLRGNFLGIYRPCDATAFHSLEFSHEVNVNVSKANNWENRKEGNHFLTSFNIFTWNIFASVEPEISLVCKLAQISRECWDFFVIRWADVNEWIKQKITIGSLILIWITINESSDNWKIDSIF